MAVSGFRKTQHSFDNFSPDNMSVIFYADVTTIWKKRSLLLFAIFSLLARASVPLPTNIKRFPPKMEIVYFLIIVL